jgi:hypothetical protein
VDRAFRLSSARVHALAYTGNTKACAASAGLAATLGAAPPVLNATPAGELPCAVSRIDETAPCPFVFGGHSQEKQVDAWSAAMLLTRFFQNPGSAVRVKLRSIERRAPAAQQQQQRHQQRPQRQPQQQRRPRQQHQPEAGAGMEGAAAAPSGDEDPGGSSSSSSDAAVGPSLPAAEEGAKG